MWNHKRLLLSSTSATTKHYATCQVIHKEFTVSSSVLLYTYNMTVWSYEKYCSWMRFWLSHMHACSYLSYELCFSSLLQYGTILSQAWIGPGCCWIRIESCFSMCLETALTLLVRGLSKALRWQRGTCAVGACKHVFDHGSYCKLFEVESTNGVVEESRWYNNTCPHACFFFQQEDKRCCIYIITFLFHLGLLCFSTNHSCCFFNKKTHECDAW